MNEFVDIFRHAVMYACLAALAVIAVGVFAMRVLPPLMDSLNRYLALDRIGKFVVAIAIVFCTLYGGSKSLFRFDSGLSNNGSYSTNDTVHVAWVKQAMIPAASTAYISYRLSTDTNGEWQVLGSTSAGSLFFDHTLANATNYDFFTWTEYVPPAPVHTNGVWCGYGELTHDGRKYLTINGKIIEGGETIATPNQKRKDGE